jgi:hypothetical protein
MQSRTVGEKILRHTRFGTRVEGTTVVMTLGNANVTMDYETAIKLSVFLRHAGRLAKKAAGDNSLKLTVFADLQPENAEELQAVMSVDRKSVFFPGA